jgi:trans-L-3-hydroxyproline dehydratase
MAESPPLRLAYVDLHTAAEPVRIVTSGYPALAGTTILEKRRQALEQHDHLRRAMMLEPRGHAGMYGVIPIAPSAGADLAVLFTHNEGYSTMCGHATIAIGRWAVETGLVAMANGRARFGLETPCGMVRVEVTDDGGAAPLVEFKSVPAFVDRLDVVADVPGFGAVRCDIAYGGAYYAILPASRLGLDLHATSLQFLIAAGVAVTDALRAKLEIRHPEAEDLGFLYGTLLTDDAILADQARSSNLCIFAKGQVDRSPTGSGVTARLALAAEREAMRMGDSCEIAGVSGQSFRGTLASVERSDHGKVSRVRVAGRAYHSGRGEFVIEPADPFREGFEMPDYFPSTPPVEPRF